MEPVSSDLAGYLSLHERKDLLRFIACGSVDDGKSTLIGRLLYESKVIFEDQLASHSPLIRGVAGREGESRFCAAASMGYQPSGSRASRSTWPTAFLTEKRKFIVADTPGHEQYRVT